MIPVYIHPHKHRIVFFICEFEHDCRLCLQYHRNPKILPCGHIFCSDCLLTALSEDKMSCCICNKPFLKKITNTNNLKEDIEKRGRMLNTFVDDLPGVYFEFHEPVGDILCFKKLSSVDIVDLPFERRSCFPYCNAYYLEKDSLYLQGKDIDSIKEESGGFFSNMSAYIWERINRMIGREIEKEYLDDESVFKHGYRAADQKKIDPKNQDPLHRKGPSDSSSAKSKRNDEGSKVSGHEETVDYDKSTQALGSEKSTNHKKSSKNSECAEIKSHNVIDGHRNIKNSHVQSKSQNTKNTSSSNSVSDEKQGKNKVSGSTHTKDPKSNTSTIEETLQTNTDGRTSTSSSSPILTPTQLIIQKNKQERHNKEKIGSVFYQIETGQFYFINKKIVDKMVQEVKAYEELPDYLILYECKEVMKVKREVKGYLSHLGCDQKVFIVDGVHHK